MAKLVLFVGDPVTLLQFSGFDRIFEEERFRIAKATTFEEAAKTIETQGVSVVVVYANMDVFSTQIDAYQGNLPPIIFWTISGVRVPKSPGVDCVEPGIAPTQMMAIANDLLRSKKTR